MTEQNQDPAKPYWDKQQRQLMLEHDGRAQSLLAPPGSQPRNEVTIHGTNYDGALTGEDDEYYDDEDWSDDEPDGYECMCCGNIQEYGYGMTCRKCMGPCDEFSF